MRISIQTFLAGAVAVAIYASSAPAGAQSPLALNSARITIAGTSNVHEYTASTSTVRITRAQLGSVVGEADLWAMPGGIEAFEVAIPAATLTSPREGIDKNMHKALKVTQHADITFRLQRVEWQSPSTAKAVGTLRIAGVEREVALPIEAKRAGATLTVKGELVLLMTDYGIAPPKAMLGMLKTDPKVTVTFETVIAAPQT